MVGDHIKYLLAALNSRIIHWYFLTCTGTTSGVGTNRWLKYTVETIPIPMPSEAQIQRIEELVDAVLSAKRNKEDTKALEDEIDQQIIMAYGLTAKERDFVFSCP